MYLVLCFSAGVGRAGTFCIIYSAICELNGTGNIGKNTTMLNNNYLLFFFVFFFQCFPNWHFHARDCQIFKSVGVRLCFLYLSPTLRQMISCSLFFISVNVPKLVRTFRKHRKFTVQKKVY